MIRFLEAVWVGSGGNVSDFPAKTDLGGGLTDPALEFLLDLEAIEDPQFWHGIGRRLTVEQVGRLDVEGYSRNLQLLVTENLDVLTAKICRVLEDEPRIGEDRPDLYWVIERSMLTLRGLNFSAYVASVLDAVTVAGPKRPGIALDALLERDDRHEAKIGTLRLVRGDRHVEYGSETDSDVIHDAELSDLSRTFGPTARVRRAFAQLSGGRELEMDFECTTASGRTAAKLPVRVLLLTSLALFRDLAEDDLQTVLPAPSRRGNGQLAMELDE